MSLHIFRLIIFPFVSSDQISMAPFMGCLRGGVVSVPKAAIAPLGPDFKTGYQLIPHFQVQGLNL